MSEALVSKVNELLNEEKWTRAALNNYTVNNFKELDAVLEEVFEAKAGDEVLETTEEHLQHTKNSIIALYLSGIINLNRQTVDDTNMILLINIFSDNHKWGIVEYLAERILDFGENKFALRTLAECFENENQPEKIPAIWERLIRVDYEEADIVRSLAELKEEEGNHEEATVYYKKALHRYINKRLFTQIREIWSKLVEHAPKETEFYYHAETKIAKQISEERAVQLLEELYPYFRDEAKWDTAIEILKRILSYDSRHQWARKEIVDCFRARYTDHSQLEEYIRLSNLNQSWRNIHDAIADFEKHIAFDANNFVFHRTWGVGIIRSIVDDEIVIDFAKKRGHKMSLKMGVNALDILARDHIWVLKSVTKKEALRKKVKEDPAWALRIVIRSLDNAADMKKIKAELVPSILTQSEWSTWSSKARDILKEDKSFGNVQDKLDHYMVRDQPVSLDEKIYHKFKSEKTFFDRIKTMYEFLAYLDREDEAADTDRFREMFDYFAGFLKSGSAPNEFVVSAFLLVRRIVQSHPYLNPGVLLDFRELYEQIPDVEEVFSRIDNKKLKDEFLSQVRKNLKEWPQTYARLFPQYLQKDILDELHQHGHQDMIAELYQRTVNNFRDLREAFVWFTRTGEGEEWYSALSVDYEKVLIAMIHLLDITFRDIGNRRDVAHNRKINKQIQSYLFKDKHLSDYVETAPEESIARIYSLLEDVKELDPSIRLELRHRIIDRFPNFHFYGQEERETVSRGGFMVTAKMFEQKQKDLRHIHEVEVPANSEEIARARDYGDLKENAEYKAAKEHQEQLNATAAKLQEEIERAQIIEPRDVDESTVSFGTTVYLLNVDTGDEEVYTVLGPWESRPSERVISYTSPLGGELYNHKTGDQLSFEINEKAYNYKVQKIEVADF